MKFELLHPADQLVMIMDRIYGYGMTTTSGGNLSILDSNGDIWITPGGVDKGTLTRKDIIQVKPDGTLIGIHKPSVELPFHRSVYQKRPDIKAVLHAHPPALISFSIVRKIPDTYLIPNAHLVCGKVDMAEYAVPGSQTLGDKISKVFERGINTVILENHGIVVAGMNLFEAFMRFETLDFCARLQIMSNQLGTPVPLSTKHMDIASQKRHSPMNEFIPTQFSSEECAARRDLCDLIHRAYDQRLFTSTQGTFSMKLSDGAFLITPYNIDRKYMAPEDIVRIEDNYREAGKTPSRSVMLHQKIYKKHPDIRSVIIAHPPNIMAFGITRTPFDSRTIPESYIMLREVQSLPFGVSFMQPDMLSDTLSSSTPIVLVENDCVIVTGSSLLNAFDRLEVAEFSAKALISAISLGDVVKISDHEVAELKEAFKLN